MDQTQLPQDGGQPAGSEDQQPSGALPVASPLPMQASNEHDGFPEDTLLEDEAAGWSAQFVAPFQQSGPLPTVNPQPARASTNQAGTPAQGRATPRRFPTLRVALISTLIVLAAGFLALSVFAQPASHLTTVSKNSTQGPGTYARSLNQGSGNAALAICGLADQHGTDASPAWPSSCHATVPLHLSARG